MKAWDIVGYTYNADVYCSDCGVVVDVLSDEEPNPVFSSDEIPDDWRCVTCELRLW